MTMPGSMPLPPARRHDIDALRVGAFALLILYHVGMYYVLDWGWHVKSVHQSEWLQYPMLALNRWRMLLLFVISGLAVAFMRRKGTVGGFARTRSWRLLVPLAFGMAVIVPIQPYAECLSKGLIEPGFGGFLLQYWSGRGFPPDAYGGWEHGWTWNHLWYLVYLWVYTMVFAALLPWLEGATGQRVLARLRRLRGAPLLLLPVLPFLLAHTWLDGFPETHALFGDWFVHAIYFTGFAYGYVIGTDAGLWAEFKRQRRTTLVLAVAAFAVYVAARTVVEDSSPLWQVTLVRVVRWSYAWWVICALFGYSHQYLNRPFTWLPYATQAVYPWYIVHQSLIILFGWFVLRPLQLGPVAEPVLLVAMTVAGCLALHHLVVLRVRWLQPLMGVEPSPRVSYSRASTERRPSHGECEDTGQGKAQGQGNG